MATQSVSDVQGAGVPLVITGTDTTDGRLWSVRLDIQLASVFNNAALSGNTPAFYSVTNTSGAYPITAALNGSNQTVFTVPLPRVLTNTWPVGNYIAQLIRTDTGTDWPLATIGFAVTQTSRPNNT